LQKVLIKEGFEPRRPKNCVELAIKHRHINFNDEDVWKEMLSDRNLTIHTYRAETATLVLNNIISKYVASFELLLKFFKENY